MGCGNLKQQWIYLIERNMYLNESQVDDYRNKCWNDLSTQSDSNFVINTNSMLVDPSFVPLLGIPSVTSLDTSQYHYWSVPRL